MKFLLWLFVFAILFFIGARYVERNNIYFPTREINETPQTIGLPYEEIYFKTADNKTLHGWFVPGAREKNTPPAQPSRRVDFTVLFCHGNGGNISHRLEKIAFFHRLGLDVFIFDYRGYGKSQGSPSESGLYKDAEAAYAYLTKKRGIPEKDIIIFGESLGGAVAVDLAQKENPRALITEDAFSSVRDMAKVVYPFAPPFVISQRFDSVSKIKNVKCPKLIIHSADDEVVPFYQGKKLFDTAAPPKKFLKTRGSHNTTFFDSQAAFTEGVRSFLSDLS